MNYEIKNRRLNGIGISKCQAEVLEVLIKMNGEPITGEKIVREIEQKRGVALYRNNVTSHIRRINKKTNGLIKNRRTYGYYIDEEIKIC